MIPLKDVIRPRSTPLAAIGVILLGTIEFAAEDWMSFDMRHSWLDVAINASAMWIFADNVEDRLGRVLFLSVYAICTAAGLAGYAFAGSWMPLPILLSTGGAAGVLGVYLTWYPRSRVLTFFPLPPDVHEVPAVLLLPMFAVLHAAAGLPQLTEALVGFATGAALSALVARPIEW